MSDSPKAMMPERFAQIRRIFEAAVELAPAARALISKLPASEISELRKEVERMLKAAGESHSMLDGPAVELETELTTTTQDGENITALLNGWKAGDKAALDKLVLLVYPELQQLSRRYMHRERSGHTLQTTALVNEVYLRMLGQGEAAVANRGHFFAIAAQLMRQLLVDHARGHRRLKRGGGARPINLEESLAIAPVRSDDVIALNEALDRLAAVDERKSKVVELRFFGGLGVEEIAAVLNVSPNTIIRDWSLAKAWLNRHLRSSSK